MNWPTAVVAAIAILAAASVLRTWILRKNTTVTVNKTTDTDWKK